MRGNTYLSRFCDLARQAEEGPFGMSLRALLRKKRIPNSTLIEFEVAIYCQNIVVFRKTALGHEEDAGEKTDGLLGAALKDATLFGLFIQFRQTQQLADDYPEARIAGNYLTPDRLGLAKSEGELTADGI